jgi:hypothetical protein
MTFQRTAAEGPLLLADISGYTSFLTDVEVAHRHDAFANGAIPEAYGLMSSLLDGIVARVVPPFTLAKIEADAVFAFATADDAVPRGEALLECVRALLCGVLVPPSPGGGAAARDARVGGGSGARSWVEVNDNDSLE